jgi:hypothetical protein
MHGVILGHDLLLILTQDFGEVRADPGDEGLPSFGNWHPKRRL